MKNKKSLIAIIAVLLVAVVGVTFAYFQTTGTFENLFQTGTYRLVTTEVFESPENWAPGETVEKTIVTKNEGTVPAAVRVSYTEQWLDSEENDITSSVEEGSAIINFDNTDEWIEENGYYYYKYILNPKQKTSSFIKSVTLSEDLDEVSCTTEGTRQICESTNPALHAKYILTITKETIEADKYSEWNSSVELTEKEIVTILSGTKGNLQPGDIVGIGETEDFYVISSDNSTNGKTVLLARYSLMVGDIEDSWDTVYTYSESDSGYGLQSIGLACNYNNSDCQGVVRFTDYSALNASNHQHEYWMNGNTLKSPYNPNDTIAWDGDNWQFKNINNNERVYPYIYDDNSLIYQYISGPNGYIDKLKEMGAPGTITGRLLSYEEAESVGSVEVEGESIVFGEQSYWFGSAYDKVDIWSADQGYPLENFHSSGRGNQIRPVIEIYTSDIK